MKKISYLQLQKKYSGKVVALDKKESQVIAVGKKFPSLFKKLESKGFSPQDSIFVGPIQKAGTTNVYFFSLSEKTD